MIVQKISRRKAELIMGDKNLSQNKATNNIKEDGLFPLDYPSETLKAAIEVIIKEKPEFKKKSLIELNSNNEFQQMFKKYITKTSTPLTETKTKIKNLNENLALITDKDYKHALSPFKNSHAYIQQLEEEFIQQLEFDPDNGTMNIKDNLLDTITLQDLKTRSNLKELDLQLLRSLYTVIYQYADKIDTRTVTVSLPILTKHLGINIRGDKPNDLFAKIKAFDNVIGVLTDGSVYRLLTFLEYDRKTNSIAFGSPYMNKILRTLQEVNAITPKKGTPYIKPHHSFLIHGSIANERNKPAVEIVCNVVALLQQRGETKLPNESLTAGKIEKIVTKAVKKSIREEFNNILYDEDDAEQDVHTSAHKKISELIKEIPILDEALNKPTIDKNTNLPKSKTARDINLILKRAFSGAYTLLKEKTDIYKYYNDLKITEIVPTASTIDQVIEISHNGINRNYQKM
jgi:hypothetical protein